MKQLLKNSLSNKLDYLLLVPNFLIVTLIPLIVYLKVIPVESSIIPYYSDHTEALDFFSYYKAVGIIILSALSIISILIGLFFKKVKIKKRYGVYVPITLHLICIFLSTAISIYPHTAVFGFPERYEGMLVLLSYMAILLSTYTLVNDKTHSRMLLAGMLTSAAIVSIIGLFQYLGLDLFQSTVGRWIILSSQYRDSIAAIQNSTEVTAIYSTLYNPNNFGIYICMMLMISFCKFLFSENGKKRILLSLLTCLLFINLLGSNARSSVVGALVSLLLAIFITRRLWKLYWRRLLLLLALFIVIGAGINITGGGVLVTRLESIVNAKDLHVENNTIDKIKGFQITGNQLVICCSNSTLTITASDNHLKVTGDPGGSLSLEPANGEKAYTFRDPLYQDYLILLHDNLLKVQKGKSYLFFAIQDNSFLYLNKKGEAVAEQPVETFGFAGLERIGSGRGYIWSRTLPLLKHTLLLGHGPDTFAMFFPQSDYVGKLRHMFDVNIIIDKPHNWYLQTAVNTGVLSLLALLVPIVLYWVQSFKLLSHSTFTDYYSTTGLAVLSAITGYLAASFFVDSTVSVAPTFWVLLGIGISINQLLAAAHPQTTGGNSKKGRYLA